MSHHGNIEALGLPTILNYLYDSTLHLDVSELLLSDTINLNWKIKVLLINHTDSNKDLQAVGKFCGLI